MQDISIITVNLNNKQGLERTISSVLKQTYRNFEFILIDGGSTDGSVELIQEHSAHATYWISEQDKGIYDAMNKGVMKATGAYLLFLNSGDILYEENVLQKCIGSVHQHKDVDIFYGDIADNIGGKETRWEHPRNLTIPFFRNNNLCHQSALIKADLFKEFGLYPPEYKLAGDHWMFLISFVNDKKFRFHESLLVNCQSAGLSFRNRVTYDEEMAQIWSKLVPGYASDIVDKYLRIEYASRYPFLKKIVPLHDIIIYKKKMIIFSLLAMVAAILLVVFTAKSI